MPSNSREFEDSYFLGHPACRIFRGKASTGQKHFEELIGGSTATGDYAGGAEEILDDTLEGQGQAENDDREDLYSNDSTINRGLLGDSTNPSISFETVPRLVPGSDKDSDRASRRLTTSLPSQLRSHCREDVAALSLERSLDRGVSAIL